VTDIVVVDPREGIPENADGHPDRAFVVNVLLDDAEARDDVDSRANVRYRQSLATSWSVIASTLPTGLIPPHQYRETKKGRWARAQGKRARRGVWIIRKHTTSTWSAALMGRSTLGIPPMSSDALLCTMLEREDATPDPIDLSLSLLPGRSTAKERHCEQNVSSSACHVSRN